MPRKINWTFLLLVITCCSLSAQEEMPWLQNFNIERQSINEQGMLLLGSWSISNIAWSAFNLSNSNGLKQSYHQMNLGWNAVNLAIAGFGYYQSQNLESLSLLDSWEAQESIKRILAVNAALDIAYMAGGFYLRERAKNRPTEYNRWEGFGRALIVNGAFLFTFDLILYWVHQQHGSSDLMPYLENLHVSPNRLGINIKL